SRASQGDESRPAFLEALLRALSRYATLPRLAETQWFGPAGAAFYLIRSKRTASYLDFRAISWHFTAMTLDIKICGLKTEDAVTAALEGGASHLGFIFFEKSP